MLLPPIRIIVLWIALPLLFVPALRAQGQTTAYTLDTTDISNISEMFLADALAGLVNRDAPRLFVVGGTPTGHKLVQYLETEKNFHFERLRSLNDAIAFFATQKRADGITPLIKGLVKYPSSMSNYYNYWIACNFAAQEDLLPVTAEILLNQTPLLSRNEFWTSDTAMTAWSASSVTKTNTASGLSITSNTDAAKCAAYGENVSRWVDLKLSETPKIEVVVSSVSSGASWSLGIDMGSTVPGSPRVPALTNVTSSGTFVIDLNASGLFNPTEARAKLSFCVMTPSSTVVVKSIRFLDASGNNPSPHVPSNVEFSQLTITRDLTNLTQYPQLATQEEAVDWSIDNQFPLCSKDALGGPTGEAWASGGIDYLISQKIYMYHENLGPFVDPTPNLDYLQSHLNSGALIGGWPGDSETYLTQKHAEFGGRHLYTPSGASFWAAVPHTGVKLPQVRRVSSAENLFYVNLSEASGDAFSPVVTGYWHDPLRGTMPLTWGLNPSLAQTMPAFVEYFANTATEYDSFWAGPSGAGYTQPSVMLPDDLNTFATITRRDIDRTGICAAVDYWDTSYHWNAYKTFTTGTSQPPVKMILPYSHGSGANQWMDDGTPLITPAGKVVNLYAGDNTTTPTILADRIKEVAALHPEAGPSKAPFFITCNVRFSPTFYQQAVSQLPTDQFKLVGMPDFVGLAQEVGGFTAVPYAEGVGAGDTLKVGLALRNPAGAPVTCGNAGTISWTLPPGWTSSPASWAHGPVATGTTLTQMLTLIPPLGLTNGTVSIKFSDDRVSWNRTLILNTYAGGGTVTNCADTAGWAASDGAAIEMENSMIKVISNRDVRRPEYTRRGSTQVDNGRVSFPLGKVDLSRQPFLEINIPDQHSIDTRIGVTSSTKTAYLGASIGKQSYVCSLAAVGTTGVQDLTLTIDPARRYGHYVAVRAVKVHYGLPQSAPVVVNSGTVNLDSNKYAVINAGTLYCSAANGSTFLNTLDMVGSGTLSLGPNTTLPLYQLSGSGTLTILGSGGWNYGVRLADGNPLFTGRIVVSNTWLWATDASLGAVPAVPVADAISLNSTLSVSGTLSANRGITLTGWAQIYGSLATLNNRITGPYGLTVRNSSIVLANGTNDFTGDYSTYNNTTTIGVDNALPHGIGKGNLRFTDWDGGVSTVDLNGHILTLNAITQTAISASSNIDNKAAGAATLVVGGNNASGTFGGVIKNTGGPLSLTKIGTGKQTLTNMCTYTGPTLVSGGTLALTGTGSIANSSTVTVAAGAVLDATGRSDGKFTPGAGQTLVVEGTVLGLFQFGGVSPGTGTIVLSNSLYAQSGAAALNITLTGPGRCGRLALTGPAGLGGFLNVTTAVGFTPQLGDQFTLLTATALSGTFSTVNLPPLPPGQWWNLTYGATSVQLTVTGMQWDADAGTSGAQGGSGPWDVTNIHWFEGGSGNVLWPNTNTSTAAFGAGPSSETSTVTISGAVNAGGFLFNTGDTPYLLTGGTIMMSGSALPILVNDAPVTIDSLISGTGSLIKQGPGTLTLTGGNTYGGEILVSKGMLALTGAGTLANASTITVATGAVLDVSGRSDGALTLGTGQSLVVSGQFIGALQSNGNVTPGSGLLSLGGNNYAQLADASLRVTITSSENCGALSLSGSAALNGSLIVTLAGYTPKAGDQFTVLTANSVSGMFANIEWPTLPAGLLWKIHYGPASVTVAVTGQFWDVAEESEGTQPGNGIWDLSNTNWFDGVGNSPWPDNNPNSRAVFGPAPALRTATVTISGSVSAGEMLFDSGATPYLITGGTIAMSGSSMAITTNGDRVSIDSDLSGTGNLIKNGAAKLTLRGSTSYGGETTVNGGILSFSTTLGNGKVILNGGTLAYTGTQAKTITDPTVDSGGGTFSVSSGNLTLAGLTGTGTAKFSTSVGAWQRGVVLSGTNPDFTGAVVVTDGWLFAQSDLSFGAIPASYKANAITMGAGSSLTPVSGTLTIPENRGITLSNNANPLFFGNIVFGSKITGAASLTSRGVQTFLNNSNNYTGETYLHATTLKLGNTNTIPHGAGKGNVTFRDWSEGGSTLDMAGWSTTINGLSCPTPPIKSEYVNNTGALPATLTVGDNNATASFGGILRNTGSALSLTKIGTGTQTLTNINTHTGATTVSSGTLALKGLGSISNSTIITVAEGTTLDVIGRLDASLTVAAAQILSGNGSVNGGMVLGGTLSPGNGSAQLTISGNYSQSSTGILDVKLLSTNVCDQVAVGGAASLGGTLNVTIPNGYIPHVGDQFTLLSAGSLSGAFATTSLPALTTGLSWIVNYGASSVQLGVSGRPAPASYAAYAEYHGLGAENVDPDGTGLTNLMRYALGVVPGGHPTFSPTRLTAAAGGLTFAFDRNIDTTSLNYHVETASTPAGPWTVIAWKVQAGAWSGSASVSETVNAPGVSRIIVSKMDESARIGFFRLRVEDP